MEWGGRSEEGMEGGGGRREEGMEGGRMEKGGRNGRWGREKGGRNGRGGEERKEFDFHYILKFHKIVCYKIREKLKYIHPISLKPYVVNL